MENKSKHKQRARKKNSQQKKQKTHKKQKKNKKVAAPLVTSHFWTLLSPPQLFNFTESAVWFSNGGQSLLKFVELFPTGDHGC